MNTQSFDEISSQKNRKSYKSKGKKGNQAKSQLFEGGTENDSDSPGEDVGKEQFVQEMSQEKIRLRNQALKIYFFGVAIAMVYSGLFMLLVRASNWAKTLDG